MGARPFAGGLLARPPLGRPAAGGGKQPSVVLLSHDHPFDNLGAARREVLPRVGSVLTTEAGAGRRGPPAAG